MDFSPNPSLGSRNPVPNLGKLGEQLVAQWLKAQGWTVLHHRWHCRWGEIDLIAQPASKASVAFVEVKTRSRGNWDANGLLAMTSQKQTKLATAAALFLAESPNFANLPCRFDLALVSYKKLPHHSNRKPVRYSFPASLALGQPIPWGEYQLSLQNYIQSAFEIESN